jgi:RNA polymerase sigma-70 factor (ECF subfamily)
VGDEQFHQLVAEYGGKVLAIAQRVCGSADAALDVHQEVFLTLWKRRRKFTAPVNWNAYLYRTTVRKALEYAQKQRKEKALDIEYEKHLSAGDCPADKAQAAELLGRLRKALRKLPHQQAQVFILARLEGLDYPQIAQIVGCSEATARVHLHRALRHLAHLMRDVI